MTSAPQPTTARRFAVFSGEAEFVAHFDALKLRLMQHARQRDKEALIPALPAWHGTAGEPQTGQHSNLLKHCAGTISMSGLEHGASALVAAEDILRPCAVRCTICSRSLMVKPVIYNRQSVGSSPIASTNLRVWQNVNAGVRSRRMLFSDAVSEWPISFDAERNRTTDKRCRNADIEGSSPSTLNTFQNEKPSQQPCLRVAPAKQEDVEQSRSGHTQMEFNSQPTPAAPEPDLCVDFGYARRRCLRLVGVAHRNDSGAGRDASREILAYPTTFADSHRLAEANNCTRTSSAVGSESRLECGQFPPVPALADLPVTARLSVNAEMINTREARVNEGQSEMRSERSSLGAAPTGSLGTLAAGGTNSCGMDNRTIRDVDAERRLSAKLLPCRSFPHWSG